MKRLKRIIALCLIPIMSIVYIPTFDMMSQAQAATGDRVEFTYTPTKNNPISKIILEEQENGNYKVIATVKRSLFTESITQFNFVDADLAKAGKTCMLVGHYVNDSDSHEYTYISGSSVWTEVAPGETKNLACGAVVGSHYNKDENGSYYLVSEWWDGTEGYAALADKGIKFTAPCKTHTWNSGKVTTAATCTTDGVKTFTCTVCKSTKTEVVNRKGHSYADATCKEPKKCKTCGATTGSALGHTWNSGKVTKAATCTTDGVKTFTCTVCSETKTEVIGAKGHNYVSSVCTECGDVHYTTFEETKTVSVGQVEWAPSLEREIYVKEFTAAKYQKIYADVNNYTSIGVGLYDAAGNLVASSAADGTPYLKGGYELPKAGKYVLKVICTSRYATTCTVTCKLEPPLEKIYSFKDFEVTSSWIGKLRYRYKFLCDREKLYLNGEKCSGTDSAFTSNILLYRENVATKQIKLVQDIDYRDGTTYLQDSSGRLGKQYTYYVIKKGSRDRDFESGQLPAKVDGVLTLTNATRTKLKKFSQWKTVTLPKPIVDKIAANSIKKTGGTVKKRTVSWKRATANGYGSVSYYMVKVFNPKGKQVVSKKIALNSTGNATEFKTTVYVPYSGTSTLKITPYLVYDGKTYTGTTKSTTITSPKLQKPTALTVTKVSSSKVVITMNPHYNGAKGYVMYQKKAGSSTWKKLVTTTNKTYTVKGTGAGSAQYKFKCYVPDDGLKLNCASTAKKYYSEYSRIFKTEKNIAYLPVDSNPNNYRLFRKYTCLKKVWYDGSKLKATVAFVNTHGYKTSFSANLVIKVNGKAICSKTKVSTSVLGNDYKEVTVTLKNGKTGYDLLGAYETGKLGWSK